MLCATIYVKGEFFVDTCFVQEAGREQQPSAILERGAGRGLSGTYPDVVHIWSRQHPTLEHRQRLAKLVDNVQGIVRRHIQERLQDETRVFRIAEEVVARLDALENLADLVVVPRVLREGEDGAVSEEED